MEKIYSKQANKKSGILAQLLMMLALVLCALTGRSQACSLVSTLPCPQVRVDLPYVLNFSGSQGGLTDKSGVGTGFTMADPPSAPLRAPSNPAVPGYEPSLLQIASGRLQVTTTAGIAYLQPSASARTNSQVNALGVGLNASAHKNSVEVTLLQPPAGSNNSEQGGLWFGLDENNYIKLDVMSWSGGTNVVEMRREVNGLSAQTADRIATGGMSLSSSTVRLRMLIDNAANSVEGFYTVNGGKEVRLGSLSIPASFIAGKTLSDGSTTGVSFAGILATHRNATASLTYVFDDFRVTPVDAGILSFAPTALSFSVEQGTATETQSAVLSANQGAPVVTLSKSINSDWLVLPASASPGSLPFSVNTDGLPVGTYQATVTASASGYTPATLQVNLTVSAPPTESTLSWSPTALNFSVVQEGGAASQSSTLSANEGLPTVSLSKSAGSNWLILPASPVLGPLSFSVEATGLAIGTYTATVTASASGYTDAVLQVKLDVTSTSSTKSILFTHSSQSMEVRQGSTEGLLNYIYTSDNTPVSARLTAVDENGNLPTWLSVNGAYLNGLPYTTGSEISFDFDATTLSVGTYKATVTASASGYADAMVQIQLIVTTESNTSLADYKVNFQDGETPVPSGWVKDYGQAFGLRSGPDQGKGLVYGWKKASGLTPVDLTLNGRNRNTALDVVLNTFMHMQMTSTNTGGTAMEALWEAEVPNGNYDITISVGDASYIDSKHSINVEGFSLISQFVPTEVNKHASATITVTVADGYLTLDASGGTNTKINSVIIKPSTSTRPYVKAVSPMEGSEFVSVNTSVSTDILSLPNGGVDNTTLSGASVKLKEVGSDVIVSGHVNGTGGGDAITLVPQSALKSNTQYRFEITSDVKDLSGASFIPYASTFKTGDVVDGVSGIVTFERTELPNTAGRHTSLTVGPDGKLYASTIDGKIKRFTIKADGTLEAPQIISSLGSNRMIVGLAFDPASTAENLIAWVTHSTSVFFNGPEWDGKLTKLSGQNLEKVQDVLINLPRSVKDHLTNSIAFGPDGALYFTQGSNSAMGRADGTWGNREDNLLSATVLRLNVSGLSGLSLPINVKTSEGGGTYNPFAANAPLTIYASGVRNAYDLVWHSNGKLYVPTNGSAAGGNTPASVAGTSRVDGSSYSGPSVPALTDVNQTMRDYLFRVEKGGYYGHPSPLRGEYVMNGGNPTSSGDLAQVQAYPIGINPDANWRGFAFDFNSNKSPNGIIEYKGNAFEGALKGKLMVVRYSQNDDIIILEPGADFDIAKAIEGLSVPGFSGFYDPLDLTEDVRTGFIYVSEYGGDGRISLVKPKEIHRGITLSTERIVDNDVVDSNPGQNRTVTVSNTGSSNIVVSGISLAGNSPGQYVLSGLPAFPKTIEPGSNFVFNVAMKASSTGLKTASIQVASNDEKKPTVTAELRGLGTSGLGGTNEPSLQAILNVHDIPVKVGDDDANTNIIHSSTTEQKAALLGEEVSIQIFQKADAGNVTIEPLSVFGPTATNPIVGFGWYKAGDPTAKNEVFTVSNSPASNGQTVVVNTGAPLAFDPASASFGFYSRWPFFDNRHLYSEDQLNTFSGSIPHHVRVYPLKDNSGAVVTNAYIIAFEEHTSGFDYQDVVFIARNLKPATPVGSVNSFRVNFQPATAATPEGYAADTGLAYDETRGFGWIDQATKTPKANDFARLRTSTDGLRLQTLNHLQHSSNPQAAWEYKVPNGSYEVTVSVGDASYYDSKHTLNIEGVPAVIGFVPTSGQKFKSGTVTVAVSDGKLTIDAAGGTNTKINYVIIDPVQVEPIQSPKVNFQPATATAPEGYTPDTGLAYDETRGFGWIDGGTKQPKVNDLARERSTADEPRLRTLNHLQHSSNPKAAWEYKVANGTYQVTVSAGDASYLDSKHTLNVEGVAAITGFVPTSTQKFKSGTVTVAVSDGKLTIDAAGGTNTKINYVTFDPIQSSKVNFQPTASTAPEGYAPDTGLAYDEARGFGWIDGGTKQPKVNDLARERSTADEPRLRTLNHLQHSSNPKAAWEYKVANGTYQVTVSAGDASYLDSKHTLNVEGVAAITGFVPTSTQKFKSGTVTVAVSDGKLTIDAAGGTNTKINYVIISPADSENDHTPPAVALKLTGTMQSENTYGNKVEISVEASDTGGSGLASTQYSLNGEAYQNYTAPLLINTLGNYTIRAKAVDGNANETLTEEVSFSVVEQVASNALLFVENRDKFPANDHLTFSRIQIPWSRDQITYNANHDLVTLRIHNKGASSLLINELILSNSAFFKIETFNNAAYDPATSLPVTLGTKAYADLTLRFIAMDQGLRVKVLHETLTIRSNDDKSPEKQVFLHGLWQKQGEGSREPWAQEIIDAFGFKTNTGYGSVDPDKGDPAGVPKGDEIRSPYFVRADPSKPVYVRQMAAYHGCCTQSESLKWYPKGGTGTTQAVYHTGLDGQTLLPRASATSNAPSEGSFSPSGAFGMVISRDWTDPAKNPDGLIGVKVWKAKDANGNVIPNAYIIANDYLGTSATNYDYNDNVYYVTNVRPEAGTAHYAALSTSPSALDFGQKLLGSTNTFTLNLTSLGKAYSDGSKDPDLQISSVQIVGENASEFTAEMPVKAVLGPQESTTLTVKFNPVQQGFKVADLLIHYNSGASPHRVPLYGVALGQETTVIVHQRINSGSATAVTVNGKTWKADNEYASGRLEPYTNPRVTQVSATDEDAIYLTEQSSSAENAPFQYEIPVSSNGEYVVRLHFAEIYWGTPGGGSGGAGSRVFSIGMEGQPRLVNFDVVQEVGSASAIVRNFPVTVTDGKLSINFTASVNRPMVAAVEVYSLRTSTSTAQAISSTEGTDFDGISKVKVYPNPLEDRFSVDFPQGYEGNVSLTIVDPAGRSMKVGDYRLEPGARTLEVNIAHLRLNRGFYYLKVESENQLGGVIKLLVK